MRAERLPRDRQDLQASHAHSVAHAPPKEPKTEPMLAHRPVQKVYASELTA